MVSVRCDLTRMKALFAGAVLLATLGAAGCGSSADGLLTTDAPGVTREPCPNPVNKDHGCIYLGTLSDLTTGPFTAMGVPITKVQRAFWDRVNRQGGIGAYDIDVVTYVRDNHYDPRVQVSAYNEIRGKVLALAQTLGSPATDAILGRLRADEMIALPVSWTSKWEFEDNILESGASYCFEAMNGVDYGTDHFGAKSVMAVHYSGDYGDDAAAGARIAAEARGLSFTDVPTVQGAPGKSAAAQEDTVRAILSRDPDLVVLTTSPADAAAIIGATVRRGYRGRFIGDNPTWAKGLLGDPAIGAMKERYLQVAPWKPFAADSPGHTAMRQALGRVEPDDSLTTGWVVSYPLKAALERAVESKDLTRKGLLAAVRGIRHVDYEGILPGVAGNSSGSPDASAFRQSVIGRPDEHEFTGIKPITDFAAGPTAKGHRLDAPCYTAG
ncbi:ABC transporter substrate-binding protein [Actinomadura madurae]|uniref:ABC transporter substrate-binding protein n=2 Tax=Actinomadura madurae TaxID=1993 RepID=UPI0020265A1F|nr:ABC transporter substrate-binding protein [Actinomadura madurae]MCP9949497.1 ABC transporter substrate-binding protein [Actinomadura madurae]MCP9966253.1 ABC transporter substrate-binding protein [Actinomadura madurae]MCP9978744.1 ABC transporter substrate-binding protein [Actinomadura madurae]MCQ0009738.1 ABC transporter substrate-binding protein [Actinomadura madurae]URN05760.1 ABC transporter substrate-binding protein [Actinomadura madurae]